MNNNKMYLIEKYMSDRNEILRVLTMSNQTRGNKEDPNYKQYETLADWAMEKHVQTKTKEILLDTIELSDRSLISSGKLENRYTTLGHLLNRLVSIMKDEAKHNPDNPLAKKVQQTTLEILTYLKNGPKPTEENSNQDEESEQEEKSNQENKQKLFAGMDWTAEKARRLANAARQNISKIEAQFYNDYYKIEYAGLKSPEENDTSGVVDKLKSLHKILVQEFTKLGYNPAVNPLAQFLKNLIKYKPDIFKKLNPNNYGAIHNSFVDKYITGNMLGNYATYKNNTILYCHDLYNYKGLDIVKYLVLQNQALNAAKENSKYATDKDLIAKMFIKQDMPNDTDYLAKIEYLFGQNPDSTITNIIPPSDKNDAKLKSKEEISEIYRYLFGASPKKQVDINAILDQAKTNDVIFDMVQHLVEQDDFKSTYKDLSDETKEWLDDNGYKRNNDNIEKCKKLLSSYLIKDVKVMQKIVTSLRTLHDKIKKASK